MIYHKIYVKEQELKKNPDRTNKKKIEALENIKYLLSKVDNTAEVIPSTDYRKLSILLSFLKGDRLNRHEKIVLKEIIEV
jgi:hypothetical protein